MENASSSSSTENLLTEEREELMVSEKGRCFEKTHFLKPNVTSIDGSVAKLPRRDQCLSVSSSELSSRISFTGFWFAERHFVSWLGKMEALHEPIWRKAGIFEAIKASTYNISKNPSLILSIAEKWCSETKSFIFPWGEATITLEDVMVLLGFSVLGFPVFAPLESSEMEYSVEKLHKVRLELSRDGRVSQISWISSFLGRDDQMEHEAFLVLWLSFFVFPGSSRRSISRHVIPIAVRLARGERIALAPTVLAFIYSDLSRIRDFSGQKCVDKLIVKSLFKLVQVWTWERFRNTRPKVRDIPIAQPRISRWSDLRHKSENVRLCFDDFEWRPYVKPLKNWNPLRFYLEEGMWITVDDNLDDEFVSYARCVRSSLLAGDGFVEDYLPNRVAMQFGLSQDLPSVVTLHRNLTEKEALDDYNKSLNDLTFYMPSRSDQGSVTVRYRDWWLKSVSEFQSFEEVQKESCEAFNARNIVDHCDNDDDDGLEVSPKVLSLSEVFQRLEEGFPAKCRRSRMHRLAKKDERGELVKSLVSSSWKMNRTSDDGMKISEDLTNKRSNYKSVPMKRSREKEEESFMDEDDDNMTIFQRIRSRKKYSDAKKTRGDGFESLGRRRSRRFQVVDSDDSGPCQKPASMKIEQQKSEEDDETARKPETKRQECDDEVDVKGSNAEKKTMINDGTKEAECCLHEDREKQRCNEKFHSEVIKEEDVNERLRQRTLAIKEIILKLEERIMKVDKSLAMIRKWKTRGNQIEKMNM